ncbi:MAG: acetyl-CoA hydrolase [Lachnospiraceae bacterium]|nr:acetyl-CoA hydrolase [Lachnospiraceae bacterium]
MSIAFEPMRSYIFTDLAKEEYRHKLLKWHMMHVEDSISQFRPYCTQYSFYQALPLPPDSEAFGPARFHLCEHYWLCNTFTEDFKNKAFCEVMPREVLRWQNSIPDDDGEENMTGEAFRATTGKKGGRPFIFLFHPLSWEVDLKGKERTREDGANYRFLFTISWPDGVAEEDGEKWLFEEVFPKFVEMPEVTRLITSHTYQDINNSKYSRVVEMWFDGPEEWHEACVVKAQDIKKPSFAQTDTFPYLTPQFNFASIFIPDIPYSDNYTQYRGFITKR